MYSTIVEAVLDHASKEPQKIAIGFKDCKVTYQELAVQMKTAAYLFSKKYNISSSDKVIISATSKIEYIVSLLGVQYLNAISVPIDKSALEKIFVIYISLFLQNCSLQIIELYRML